MTKYTPDGEFTKKVMDKVQKIHQAEQQRLFKVESQVNGLPVRTVLSLTAALCGVWNLVRIYLVLLTPVICR